MKLILSREEIKDDCTVGQLFTSFGQFVTMERPWNGNQSGVSCIPEGSYECAMRWSNAFKRMLYGLKKVSDRSNILIHNGSYPEHSLGCILIGKTQFTIKTESGLKRGIGLSRVALAEFLDRMKEEPFTLEITRR